MKKLLSILSMAVILGTFAVGSAFAVESNASGAVEVTQVADAKADTQPGGEVATDDGKAQDEAVKDDAAKKDDVEKK